MIIMNKLKKNVLYRVGLIYKTCDLSDKIRIIL